MPVRNVKKTGKRSAGDFPSLKMKRMIGFESLLERDYLYLLDFEQDVVEFEEQPLSIEYTYNEKNRRYTPDFRVRKRRGSLMIVECKPTVFTDTDENILKFKIAREWCANRGYQFQVVTDLDICSGFRLKNVKLLTRFARQTVKPEVQGKVYSILSSTSSPLTLHSLASQLAPTNKFSAVPSILCLAFHHKLALQLDGSPITGDTIIIKERKSL